MLTIGLLLLLVGLVLVVVEAHVTSGALGGLAVLALAGGAYATVDGLEGGAISAILAGLITAATGTTALVLVARRIAVSQRALPHSGTRALVGTRGRVRSWRGDAGQVQIAGELWRARLELAHEAEDPPHPGDTVLVEAVEGLTLSVRKAEAWEG